MSAEINGKYETVPQAARRANVSRQALLELIHKGRFPAVQIGGRWLVRITDTNAYIAERFMRALESD